MKAIFVLSWTKFLCFVTFDTMDSFDRMSVRLSVCLCVCPSVYLSVAALRMKCSIENE